MTLCDPNWVNINNNNIINGYTNLKWGVFSHWMSDNFPKGFKIENFGMNTLFTEAHAFYRL